MQVDRAFLVCKITCLNVDFGGVFCLVICGKETSLRDMEPAVVVCWKWMVELWDLILCMRHKWKRRISYELLKNIFKLPNQIIAIREVFFNIFVSAQLLNLVWAQALTFNSRLDSIINWFVLLCVTACTFYWFWFFIYYWRSFSLWFNVIWYSREILLRFPILNSILLVQWLYAWITLTPCLEENDHFP